MQLRNVENEINTFSQGKEQLLVIQYKVVSPNTSDIIQPEKTFSVYIYLYIIYLYYIFMNYMYLTAIIKRRGHRVEDFKEENLKTI